MVFISALLFFFYLFWLLTKFGHSEKDTDFFKFCVLLTMFNFTMQKCYQRLDPFKYGLKVDPDRTIFEVVYMKLYMIYLSFTFSSIY